MLLEAGIEISRDKSDQIIAFERHLKRFEWKQELIRLGKPIIPLGRSIWFAPFTVKKCDTKFGILGEEWLKGVVFSNARAGLLFRVTEASPAMQIMFN